jgi:hypothetical protein
VACLGDGLHSAHRANSFDGSGAGTSTNAVTSASTASRLHVTPPVNPHRMVTRAKDGFRMATKPFTFTASTPSSIPSSVRVTLADPNWRAAMEDEYGALMSNRT